MTEQKPWNPERICKRVLENKSRFLQHGEGNQILRGVLICLSFMGELNPANSLPGRSGLCDPPGMASGARCKCTVRVCAAKACRLPHSSEPILEGN